MRIIAGGKKGLKLHSPKGDNTRPVLDRDKETIFNILENGKNQMSFKNLDAGDVFAGSGGIGLEILSRGAKSCTFFENNKTTLLSLKKNIACFQDFSTRICNDALNPKFYSTFDILFFDPPYGHNLAIKALKIFLKSELINHNATVIIKIANDEDIEIPKELNLFDCRKMSGGKILFLKKDTPV